MSNHFPELLFRNKSNPILTAADWPYPVNTVFNPGATLLPDGTTLLLCRVEDRRGLSHLCAARSTNGVDSWQIDTQPTLIPDPEHFPEELWGIQDPRITFVPELNKYAVVYTAYTRDGPGVALAFTEDFSRFERYGLIMQPEDKDAALFPHRIDGHWALIHRPVGAPGGAHVDILLDQLAALGRSQTDAGSTPRWMVGRQQDRTFTPAYRDSARLACDLPWSAGDRGWLYLPTWSCIV